MQARKQIKEKKDGVEVETSDETAPAQDQEGDQAQATQGNEMNIDSNDPEVNAQEETQGETAVDGTATETVVTEEQQPPTENVDIDLNDPEVQQAASKIQAGFKGYKTRKEMSEKKNEQGEEGGD